MPYAFEHHKIKLPPELDRRRKLTEKDKEKIKKLFAEGYAVRGIARIFPQVCRRTIQFVIDPQRITEMQKGRDWKRYYSKEKHRQQMKKWRQTKQLRLKNENNITLTR
jgi:IS30 family transposase